MKLYYTKDACSLIVRIILNELTIAAEFESVDLYSKKTASGNDFLTINPKGAVPVLVINSQEKLSENAVILQYLADTTQSNQLLPPLGDFARYQVLEWLNFMATDMHKGIGILFNPKLTPELKESLYVPLIKGKLNFLNTHLQTQKYLAGDHFTLPDAYLFVMLRWVSYFKISFNEHLNLTRYFKEIAERASVKKSLQQEEQAG